MAYRRRRYDGPMPADQQRCLIMPREMAGRRAPGVGGVVA
jgi:hypothetical protein